MALSRLEKLFEDALGAIRKQRYNHACDLFAEAMEIDPQMPQIHYNMGVALSRLYRWREAAESFRLAIRIQPHPDSWVHLGLVHLHQREWEKALHDFESALRLDAGSEVAQAHRDDLVTFLERGPRSDDDSPFLCTGWFDPRQEDFVGVDPEIVPKARRRELREYIASQIGDPGECDHTHALTEEWALKNDLDPLGVSRFLHERGLRCDCEVLAEPERRPLPRLDPPPAGGGPRVTE